MLIFFILIVIYISVNYNLYQTITFIISRNKTFFKRFVKFLRINT